MLERMRSIHWNCNVMREREIDEELRMAVKDSFQTVCYKIKKEPRYKLSTKG